MDCSEPKFVDKILVGYKAMATLSGHKIGFGRMVTLLGFTGALVLTIELASTLVRPTSLVYLAS
jgi:hypothetical protein